MGGAADVDGVDVRAGVAAAVREAAMVVVGFVVRMFAEIVVIPFQFFSAQSLCPLRLCGGLFNL